jgi:hypothetical protein
MMRSRQSLDLGRSTGQDRVGVFETVEYGFALCVLEHAQEFRALDTLMPWFLFGEEYSTRK